MGNTLSSWGGQKKVASIIDKAGLPLQIDSSGEAESKRELSRFTRAYAASGWFTGVKSTVTVPATPEVVYDSLSKELQKVFTPMSECHDEIKADNGAGEQSIFRIVRIPFKVAFVTGNLKLRLNVSQNAAKQHILFESAQEGRLITKFIADFEIKPQEGNESNSIVELDAKIDAKSLPPPPFKNMVKGESPFKNMVKDVMVSKMDSCMVDLVDFHQKVADEQKAEALRQQSAPEAQEAEEPQKTEVEEPQTTEGADTVIATAKSSESVYYDSTDCELNDPQQENMERQVSQGFNFQQRRKQQDTGILAALRRSFGASLPQRRSFETRRSMEKRRQQRQSRRSLERQRSQRIASASNLHGVPLPPVSKPPLPQGPSSQAAVFNQWHTPQPSSQA